MQQVSKMRRRADDFSNLRLRLQVAPVDNSPTSTPSPTPSPTVTPVPTAIPPATSIPVASSEYLWPIDGGISTYYSSYHPALDINGQYGQTVVASRSGQVVWSGWDAGCGITVRVAHSNGSRTVYCHLSEAWVSVGYNVAQGEEIGTVGSTGYATGPHLHFELWVGGVAVDPLGYL